MKKSLGDRPVLSAFVVTIVVGMLVLSYPLSLDFLNSLTGRVVDIGSGLIGHWRFSGGSLLDVSGNGNDGVAFAGIDCDDFGLRGDSCEFGKPR